MTINYDDLTPEQLLTVLQGGEMDTKAWFLTEVGFSFEGTDYVVQYDELGDIIQTLGVNKQPLTTLEEAKLTRMFAPLITISNLDNLPDTD